MRLRLSRLTVIIQCDVFHTDALRDFQLQYVLNAKYKKILVIQEARGNSARQRPPVYDPTHCGLKQHKALLSEKNISFDFTSRIICQSKFAPMS